MSFLHHGDIIVCMWEGVGLLFPVPGALNMQSTHPQAGPNGITMQTQQIKVIITTTIISKLTAEPPAPTQTGHK